MDRLAPDSPSPWPERLLPGDDPGAWIDHMNRYRFCAGHIREKRVLELGTGGGFGASFLAAKARHLISTDIDGEALNDAHRAYARPNLAFISADAARLPFADQSFDAVVAFEILEHLRNPLDLIAETRRVLRPRGLFFVSTPNIERHYEKIKTRNPYHLTDFNLMTFTHLLRKHFCVARVYGQCPTWDIGLREASSRGKLLRKISVLWRHPASAAAVLGGKLALSLGIVRQLPAWRGLNLISRDILPEAKVFLAVCRKAP